MNDRLAGVAACIVGGALAAVAMLEYVVAGPSPSWDPLATGLLVSSSGFVLAVVGGVAARSGTDGLSICAGTAVGLGTLALAVLAPDALLFGGVFWLGLVAAGLIGAAAVGTVRAAR